MNMIRYGCHSENFGILSPEDTFQLIRSLNFDCIDVAARSLIPQAAILNNPSGCAERFRRLSQRFSLPLSELFLSDTEVDGKAVSPVEAGSLSLAQISLFDKNFRQICQFAKKAGFSSIMGGAGREDDILGFAKSFEYAASTLRRQVSIAADYGLAFYVEPNRLSLLHTVAAAQRMAQEVPGLRYTLDFLHYHVQNVPLAESIQLLPLAGHLHARQARIGVGKCDFSQGEIDYSFIVSKMKELQWQGDITMEFWCSDSLRAQGVQAIEQNIVMRYLLKQLMGSERKA